MAQVFEIVFAKDKYIRMPCIFISMFGNILPAQEGIKDPLQ